jgi:ketosteroid isomerase-like protein
MTELEQLRTAVERLAAKVQSLEDQLAIMQLTAAYGPAVDSSAGDAAAALWTEDGTFGALPHRHMTGRAEIAAMVHDERHREMLERGCSHVLTVPSIALDGDTATGRSYALQLRWDAEAQRFWVARASANTWRWLRTTEGWRIADRVNAPLDGTPGHRELLTPRANSEAP